MAGSAVRSFCMGILAILAVMGAGLAVRSWAGRGAQVAPVNPADSDGSTSLAFLRTNPQGCQEFLHERSGIVLVLLPGGPFEMGSADVEPDREPGERRHRSHVSPFLIGRTEVTNAQFRRWDPTHAGEDDLPAVGVDWETARRFAHDQGLDLPTEAQWEFAARSGDDRPFPWGTDWPPPPECGNYGRGLRCDGYSGLSPAGRFAPNGFGVFDLGGNALEWCADWYAPDPPRDGLDPRGPASGSARTARGGSWLTGNRRDARCAVRDFIRPQCRYGFLGFRVACAGDPR